MFRYQQWTGTGTLLVPDYCGTGLAPVRYWSGTTVVRVTASEHFLSSDIDANIARAVIVAATVQTNRHPGQKPPTS